MINKHLIVITFLVSSCIMVGNTQTLSEKLNAFTDKLTSSEKLDMKVDMVVYDENQKKIDQTTIEYKRDKNVSYNKIKDVEIIQDNTEELFVTIDTEDRTISLSRIAENSDFAKQLNAMFSLFDDSSELFRITETQVDGLDSYTVFMNGEDLASYYFDRQTGLLSKVIFHKSTPILHEGKRIIPKVVTTFKYNESVRGLKLSSVLTPKNETWVGKGHYANYIIQDYRDQLSNY